MAEENENLRLETWGVAPEGGLVRLDLLREDGHRLVVHLEVAVARSLSDFLIRAAAAAQLARQGGVGVSRETSGEPE